MRVHLHGSEGWSLVRDHLHGSEGWSLVRDSFTWKKEKVSEKDGQKRGVVSPGVPLYPQYF